MKLRSGGRGHPPDTLLVAVGPVACRGWDYYAAALVIHLTPDSCVQWRAWGGDGAAALGILLTSLIVVGPVAFIGLGEGAAAMVIHLKHLS